MSIEYHTCDCCGHQFRDLNDSRTRKTKQAAKVNKEGPYCELCRHLEMARRYAAHRGTFARGVDGDKYRTIEAFIQSAIDLQSGAAAQVNEEMIPVSHLKDFV